jgi:signal peptidase I
MIAIAFHITGERFRHAGRFAVDLASSLRVVVRGESMEPALSDGDRVLVSRAAYRSENPRPGDIVLLATSVAGVEMVKRILSGPGEMTPDGVNAGALLPGQYWVQGDNSAVSRDSRVFGPVDRREITGRVWYRYSPTDHVGRIRADPERPEIPEL